MKTPKKMEITNNTTIVDGKIKIKEKLAYGCGGLGSSALGWLLAIGGYVGGAATQSEGALFAMKAGQIYIPIVCFALVVLIFSFYKLDKEYPMIIEELNKRKAANVQ